MKRGKRDTDCPITNAVDVLGDRWSLLILRDIIFMGKRYYGEFLDSGEKIATNILADRLSKLECEGILIKSQDEQNKSRFRYTLTDKGLDLIPMILEMIIWSMKNIPGVHQEPELIRRMESDDRDTLIRETREAVLNDMAAK